MDASLWKDLITNIGFPIVACIGMALALKYVVDHYNALIKELMTAHKSESDKFAEALNKNTLVLEKLCERIGN